MASTKARLLKHDFPVHGNLRFPAVFCENLRFSAVSCALQMLAWISRRRGNLRNSAVFCENLRLGLSLSP